MREDSPIGRPKWTDIAIVILTGGIVLLAYMQWREMHGAGKQSDDLIKAATVQADAAGKNAKAAAGFATSADEIREETRRAVRELRRVSDNSGHRSSLARFAESADTHYRSSMSGTEAVDWSSPRTD